MRSRTNSILSVLLFSVVLHSVQSLPVSTPAGPVIALENKYLSYLFKTIEDSGRKPDILGDVNLLPDEHKGFANMVQCLAEESTTSTSDSNDSEEEPHMQQLPSNQRLLTFNLTKEFTTNTQKLVAFRLAITSQYASSFKVSVYDAHSMEIPIDSGTSQEKWIDLHLELFEQSNKVPTTAIYQLVLKIESQDRSVKESKLSEILKSLQPLLVIYSYDGEILKSLFRPPSPNSQNRITKRSISASQTLREKKNDFCQVHSAVLDSFEYFNVSSDYTVIGPESPSIDFCHGHCRHGGDVEKARQYSSHINPIHKMNPELEKAGIPCCAPKTYGYRSLYISSKYNNVVLLMTIPTVTSCHCS